MRAGKLRNPARLQRKTKTGTDEHGQPTYRWDDVGTIYCKIDDLNTRTAENARQLYAKATHQITMRYVPMGISLNDRIVYRGVEYYVGHIGNTEQRNRELILMVSSDG